MEVYISDYCQCMHVVGTIPCRQSIYICTGMLVTGCGSVIKVYAVGECLR